mmetsp:Transcript_31441/g.61309  ORF Transcript_31441/g.61309 Transcript_31441/m.61309 type:complete len:82 (-) Transcript_31441:1022-1267(-)
MIKVYIMQQTSFSQHIASGFKVTNNLKAAKKLTYWHVQWTFANQNRGAAQRRSQPLRQFTEKSMSQATFKPIVRLSCSTGA